MKVKELKEIIKNINSDFDDYEVKTDYLGHYVYVDYISMYSNDDDEDPYSSGENIFYITLED